jgi:hypothetical protein
MHNKLMIIDAGAGGPDADPRVVTGSLNWSAAGDKRNSENIVVIHGPETAAAYAAAFARWWEESAWLSCGMRLPIGDLFLPLASKGAAPASPTVPPVTPVATPTVSPAGPCACTGNLYNCPDFGSQAEAQACFDWCVSLGAGDVHQLDSNEDGVACESLPLGWQVVGPAD